ncbi:MAG: hypothetical protein ACT4OM_04925 [Actinomycetota bacterium]
MGTARANLLRGAGGNDRSRRLAAGITRPCGPLRLALALALMVAGAGLASASASLLGLTGGNIALFTVTAPPPGTPAITGSLPPSPADDNNPELTGTATGGTTVEIFTDSLCTAPPVASGSAAVFESTGITVTVADNTITTFYARSTGASGPSGCSGGFPYTEMS